MHCILVFFGWTFFAILEVYAGSGLSCSIAHVVNGTMACYLFWILPVSLRDLIYDFRGIFMETESLAISWILNRGPHRLDSTNVITLEWPTQRH